jgi:hypothetical protein
MIDSGDIALPPGDIAVPSGDIALPPAESPLAIVPAGSVVVDSTVDVPDSVAVSSSVDQAMYRPPPHVGVEQAHRRYRPPSGDQVRPRHF